MIGKLLKFVLLCAVLFAVFRLGQAFALADPEVIRIESITRYDSVAQAGDLFVLVEYTIEYLALPPENVSLGWLGRLIDVGGGGQLASIQPYAGGGIPDLGYSRGAYGFYFTEAPAITGTLRVTLEGNPSLSPTPAGIHSTSITQRNASDLAPDLRSMAVRLQDLWDIALVSQVSGGVHRYTVDGEEYFSSALPNLRQVAPDMFVLQSFQPEVPDRPHDSSYSDARQAIYDGTPIAIGFEAGGQFLNVSTGVFKFLFTFVLFVLPVAWVLGRAVPGQEYTTTLQIWGGYLVLAGGYWIGLVNIETLGIITVLCVVATAVSLFLNKTGL